MEATMSANVSLVKVEVSRVSGHKGRFQHDGTVMLRGQSAGLDFTYTFRFANEESVPAAIASAITALARELSALAVAAPKVMLPERPLPEEGTEGPEDDL
jgi:hypothetical protein